MTKETLKLKTFVVISLFILISTQVLGLLLFCVGFFPQRIPLQGRSTLDDLPDHFVINKPVNLESRFGKLVIMLVDAFRSDFLFGNASQMYYLRNLIQANETYSYVAVAQSPTVTLPRIKALTSGGIPSFLDFLFNFKSQALQEDNLITQLYHNKKKIVFYGDDTWERLFPRHFFRQEGTTSFFATDTVEVDNNVTRHLEPELEKFDWDVMILHYLGLDHIGHSEGPQSNLMGPKQREMDGIIQKIHSKLIDLDKNQPKPTLFLFCSDHGMNEVGNHGGSSEGETSAIFVFMSSLFSNNQGSIFDNHHVAQVDLVPTLSLLLGLPIPKNSLGNIINDLFYRVTNDEDYLRALQVNSFQQLQILKSYPMFWDQSMNAPGNEEISSIYRFYLVATELHKKWVSDTTTIKSDYIASLYVKFLKGLQNEFSKVLSSYDLYVLGFGIGLLFTSFIGFIILGFFYQLNDLPSKNGNQGKTLSLMVGFGAFIGGYFGNMVLCQKNCKGSVICSGVFLPITILSFAMVAASFYCITRLLCSFKFPTLSHLMKHCTSEKKWLIVGSILHLISLSGTSNVEEEHQTWFFFTMTLYFLLFLKQYHPTDNWILTAQKTAPVCALMITGRILRGWNQTGDKWAGYPDYALWFKHPSHVNYLTALIVMSLLSIVFYGTYYANASKPFIGKKTSLFYQASLLMSSILTVIYKVQVDINSTIILPIRGVWIARFVYMLILIMISMALLFPLWTKATKNLWNYFYLTTTLTIIPFLILFALLHRPVNVFLIPLLGLQAISILKVFDRTPGMSLWSMILTLHWMGNASFFFFGNSNSLSTIDIRGGYTGLDEFNEFIIPILIALTGLSGPLTFFIASFIVAGQMSFRSKKSLLNEYERNALSVSIILNTIRSSVVTLFSIYITIHRNHLFIWSVFSPKYIYELFFSIVELLKTLVLLLSVMYFGWVHQLVGNNVKDL